MMAQLTFTAIVEPDPDPAQAEYRIATIPVLPGCMVESLGTEQALAELCEAAAEYVASLRQKGMTVPDETAHQRTIYVIDPATTERLTLTAIVDDEDVEGQIAAHAPLMGEVQVVGETRTTRSASWPTNWQSSCARSGRRSAFSARSTGSLSRRERMPAPVGPGWPVRRRVGGLLVIALPAHEVSNAPCYAIIRKQPESPPLRLRSVRARAGRTKGPAPCLPRGRRNGSAGRPPSGAVRRPRDRPDHPRA